MKTKKTKTIAIIALFAMIAGLTCNADEQLPGHAPAPVLPVVPTLEQVENVSSWNLGQGYQAVQSILSSVKMATRFPNVAFQLNIDGKMVKITPENASGIQSAYEARLQVYRQAIKQRGYPHIEGWYTLQVNEALEGKEGFEWVELFAEKQLSPKEYLLVREVQIKQKDINIRMERTVDISGEIKDVSLPGLAIEESIVFQVPNINIRFYGTWRDGVIELGTDLNEIKRSLSFNHAIQPLVDAEKARDSELHKKKFSEWIVRLKRKPSNRPAAPSPDDELLVLTSDKKLRKILRATISTTPGTEGHTLNP